jgi:hypothetical protein
MTQWNCTCFASLALADSITVIYAGFSAGVASTDAEKGSGCSMNPVI